MGPRHGQRSPAPAQGEEPLRDPARLLAWTPVPGSLPRDLARIAHGPDCDALQFLEPLSVGRTVRMFSQTRPGEVPISFAPRSSPMRPMRSAPRCDNQKEHEGKDAP